MRTLPVIAASCCLLIASVAAAPAEGQVAGRSVTLQLESSFWSNLHQFLHLLGAAEAGRVPLNRETILDLRADAASVTLDPQDEAAWRAAVRFYADSVSLVEPWSEPALVNDLLRQAGNAAQLSDSLPEGVRQALEAAAPVYRRHWWPGHSTGNDAWIAAQRTLIAGHGDALSSALSLSHLKNHGRGQYL
jgi:hypothetical protein